MHSTAALPPIDLGPHQWTEYNTGGPEDSYTLQEEDRVFLNARCDHDRFRRTRNGAGLRVSEHDPDGVKGDGEEVAEEEEGVWADTIRNNV